MHNIPNLDDVNIKAYAKFGPSSSDSEQKRNSKPIEGHNSVKHLLKLTHNNPNLYLVHINAHAKFG